MEERIGERMAMIKKEKDTMYEASAERSNVRPIKFTRSGAIAIK